MRPGFHPTKPRTPGTVKACIADLFGQLGGIERVMVRLGTKPAVTYAYATAPTVTYDVIALVKAFLRQVQDDPRSWVAILKDALVAVLAALPSWRK